jgi:hypothetical protein
MSRQAARSMQIIASIQGQELHFLIDSGSTACFLDCRCAANFQGAQPLPQSIQVVAASGELLQCTHHFQSLEWSSQEYTFRNDFHVLQLQNYDGIIGLDWLAKHSPMVTH